MPSKKKAAPKAKIEEVDTTKSTATHGPNDAVTAPEPEAEGVEDTETTGYNSEHFTLRRENGRVYIAPVSWVGPAPLQFLEDRLSELSDLLAKASK